MSDDRLLANYSFVEGEYITSMTIYSGGGFDGFTMETNVRTYPHILGTGGYLKPEVTGQRMLFISGQLYDHSGVTVIGGVRVYFDIC